MKRELGDLGADLESLLSENMRQALYELRELENIGPQWWLCSGFARPFLMAAALNLAISLRQERGIYSTEALSIACDALGIEYEKARGWGRRWPAESRGGHGAHKDRHWSAILLVSEAFEALDRDDAA